MSVGREINPLVFVIFPIYGIKATQDTVVNVLEGLHSGYSRLQIRLPHCAGSFSLAHGQGLQYNLTKYGSS